MECDFADVPPSATTIRIHLNAPDLPMVTTQEHVDRCIASVPWYHIFDSLKRIKPSTITINLWYDAGLPEPTWTQAREDSVLRHHEETTGEPYLET